MTLKPVVEVGYLLSMSVNGHKQQIPYFYHFQFHYPLITYLNKMDNTGAIPIDLKIEQSITTVKGIQSK